LSWAYSSSRLGGLAALLFVPGKSFLLTSYIVIGDRLATRTLLQRSCGSARVSPWRKPAPIANLCHGRLMWLTLFFFFLLLHHYRWLGYKVGRLPHKATHFFTTGIIFFTNTKCCAVLLHKYERCNGNGAEQIQRISTGEIFLKDVRSERRTYALFARDAQVVTRPVSFSFRLVSSF
jgi:hypothetical protein